MNIKKSNRGSSADMLNAFYNKLESLENATYGDVNSNTRDDIMSSDDTASLRKDVKHVLELHGIDTECQESQNYIDAAVEYIEQHREINPRYTVKQWFLDTQYNYPEDLEELKKCGTSINSATDDYNDRYFHTLIGDVEDRLKDFGASRAWFVQEDSILLTLSIDRRVVEYDIPIADLTMDFDTIDQDADYISDFIKQDIA